MNEVRIAGAGPAGMAAAIYLAKHGCQVTVYEKRSGVGGRFNDDFQGLENWSAVQDALEEISSLGVEPSWWFRPFYGGMMVNSSKKARQVSTLKPLFYLVRRGAKEKSLDIALLNQAKGAGVNFVFNRSIPQQKADIWAVGPSGPAKAVAAGITFKHSGDDLACVLLSDQLAPSGYVYYLAADGQATLATVLFKDFSYVHKALEKSKLVVAELYGLTDFPDEKQWGGYGGFSINQTCKVNGSLLVGEAGGFQDLLFGFGIRNAVVSGGLAAKSLLEGQNYDWLWKGRLLSMLKASAVNRAVYRGFGDFSKDIFCYTVTRSKQPEKVMKWIYNFSTVHKLLFPLVARGFYS